MKNLSAYIIEAKRLSDLKGKRIGKIEVSEPDNTVYVLMCSDNGTNPNMLIILMGPGVHSMFPGRLVAVRRSDNFHLLTRIEPKDSIKFHLQYAVDVLNVKGAWDMVNEPKMEIISTSHYITDMMRQFPDIDFATVTDMDEGRDLMKKYMQIKN